MCKSTKTWKLNYIQLHYDVNQYDFLIAESGLNLNIYFHKTPQVAMNWESYAIIDFLNQSLSIFLI